VTCGKQAPETETNYTLISAQFGWRLTRYKRADGTLVLEWRCPNCWREFKRSRNGVPPSGAPGPIRSDASRSDAARSSDRFPSTSPPAPTPPPRPGRLPR
jgi:hypothetical protein